MCLKIRAFLLLLLKDVCEVLSKAKWLIMRQVIRQEQKLAQTLAHILVAAQPRRGYLVEKNILVCLLHKTRREGGKEEGRKCRCLQHS